MDSNGEIKEQTYFVRGMHCASCELLIEKEILKISGVKSVEASIKNNEVLIEYQDQKPTITYLDKIFRQKGYQFSEKPFSPKNIPSNSINPLYSFLIAAAIIMVFYILQKLGISGLVNVSSQSSLPTFFVLGLLAGISSCAALVGGIILSMSKQWSELYSEKK